VYEDENNLYLVFDVITGEELLEPVMTGEPLEEELAK
jgi:hypothetical protein